MEIMKLSAMWASAPDDTRYTTVQGLHDAAVALESKMRERENVDASTLTTVADKGDVLLVGRGGVPAKLTHWAFGQLAQRVGAPASYLRTLSAELASQNINHGLAQRARDAANNGAVSLLAHVADSAVTVHAVTGTKYERIWQREITERLLDLRSQGWDVMTPDLSLGAGFDDGKRPLYLSDHNLLAAVCSKDHGVRESGNADGLLRGVIVENSTVGASKLRLTQFLYRGICGNHIVWGAQDVVEIAVRHVGNVRRSLGLWDAELKKYLNSSATETEQKIEQSKRKLIAATKDEVLDALFGKRIPALTRKALESSYDAIVPDVDGDSRSVWGMVQGITRYSQTLGSGDARTELDAAAGKLLTIF